MNFVEQRTKMASSRFLVSLILLVVLVAVDIADSRTSSVLDISDVVFANTTEIARACTSDYPADVAVSSVTTDSAYVEWDPLTTNPSDLRNLTGYQIIYWETTNSLYSNKTVGMVDQHTLTTLKPFTQYFISVRGVCQDSRGEITYGVASQREDIFTRSTFPSGNLAIVSVSTTNDSAIIEWSGLPPDDWHGIMQGYILIIADVTPGYSVQNEAMVPFNQTLVEVGDLIPDHSYVVTVSALSSGGLGVPSEPYSFKIEKPTSPPTEGNENLTIGQVWYYLAVPAGVLLAVCATVIVILCKISYDRKKKFVYAREIASNMEDNSKFMGRMDSIRMSNRPLPAYPGDSPHPRTPSVSSMSAHLIDQTTTSPNQFQHGMSFSSADQHHFHHLHQPQPSHPPPPLSATQHPHPPHHHPPPDLLPLDLDPAHHQFRNRSVSSPQMPQLSQPLSDLSSATPSSVFTESNVPQVDENPSSPNLPKAYEVPSDSKTCHQSGGSPVLGHNTLPNPRRPHTATGVMASQPILSPHPQSSHSPISFTHSSSDVRNNHGTSMRPPDIPPHRMNSFGHQQQRPHQIQSVVRPGDGPLPSQQGLTRPESGLYSEVASDPAHMEGNFTKITPPNESSMMGQHSLGQTMINDGSIIGSDQYSDYSDIPDHIGPPMENHTNNTRHKLPSVEEEEYRKQNRLSSESMSSFSSDSQSSSPAHSKVSDVSHHHLQLNKMNSGRPSHVTIQEEGDHDYDECNSIITDNSSSVNTKVAISANPYLSPVDIVPSSNGHHPTPPSD